MTGFVLMAKNTGALMVGYRVTFLDEISPEILPRLKYQVCVAEHHGWVVEFHKSVSRHALFFNLEFEKMFENLGVL